MPKRLEATSVGIVATDRLGRRDANLGLGVVAVVYVHVHHIIASLVVVDDLGALHHAVRAEISRRGLGEQSILKFPVNEIRRRVAVDVLKWRSVCFVLSHHVVGLSDVDDAAAMCLDVAASVCLLFG